MLSEGVGGETPPPKVSTVKSAPDRVPVVALGPGFEGAKAQLPSKFN